MQNMGNGSYNGALAPRSLAAAGRGDEQAEGTGGSPAIAGKTTGGQTSNPAVAAMTNGKDYSARAAETNSEPMHKRKD